MRQWFKMRLNYFIRMDFPCSQSISSDKPILQVKVKFPQLCLTLCDPMDYPVHGILQGIFPTQWSIPGLPHCRQILLPAESPGKPKNTGVGSLFLLQWIFLTQEPCIAGRFFTNWAIRKTPSPPPKKKKKSILQLVHKYKEYILLPSIGSEIQSPPRKLHGKHLSTFSLSPLRL